MTQTEREFATLYLLIKIGDLLSAMDDKFTRKERSDYCEYRNFIVKEMKEHMEKINETITK